ncbi:MAG: hypothetical protein CVU56_29620, partial [Deltaproteobacteria bacterium HGW-Deltaproteobacteria-14]
DPGADRARACARAGSCARPGARAVHPLMAELLAWKHLTGRQIAALDPGRTVVWVSCSPVEVHGPHLPTVTDNIEARGIARAAIDHFSRRFPEVVHVEVPPVYVAADVLPHKGSLAFRPTTVMRVIEDLGRTLNAQGFRNVWVTNFHGGPRHFVAIEAACDRVNRRHGARMASLFSLLLTRLTGGSTDLSDVIGDVAGIRREDLVGDSHGGALETSLMLHLIGQHVDPVYRELGRRTVEDTLAEQGKPPLASPGQKQGLRSMVRGFREKLRYYHAETYSGTPSLATPEAGAQILDRLGEIAAEGFADLWTGRIGPESCRSPLWPARWLFTEPRFGAAFERLLGLPSPIW